MAVTSQKFVFDNRLLAVEELFRQRQLDAARQELVQLESEDFSGDDHQQGLWLSLKADAAFEDGQYQTALDLGHSGIGILAGLPFHQRYARTLFVIAKAYLYLGDLKNAETRAHDALASYRRAKEVSGQIDGLNTLARIAFTRSDFQTACDYLDEAVGLAADLPRKEAQLRGNVGRIRILQGDWTRAEEDLRAALKYHESHDEKTSQAINLLSLGFLHMRRRELVFADRCLCSALELIDDLGLKRERIIYLEYAGELALEKGDIYRAKALLNEAYTEGRRLAPDSTLVSQTGRRLAEVELALDNVDEAMKYGQKALELAVKIGEQTEVALSKRVIAQAFALRSDFADALEYGQQALEAARGVSDPHDLARTLLVVADLMIAINSEEMDRIRQLFDEAGRIFKKLQLDYWVAETDYRIGVFACQRGDLARGFKKLSRSEKVFAGLAETAKVRRVNQFLTSLADEAVALSISEDNEFRLVGKLVNQSEVEDLKTGQIDEILHVLTSRTGADRVIILSPDFNSEPIIATFEMSDHQTRRFSDNFRQMLGEEVSTLKPTLRLDCRRDPYINDLFP
ncbi:MAG: tetratricopeptide repeat protein, partial [bacterium]|nr:tetratricopeptide repeat protein [bacterium]